MNLRALPILLAAILILGAGCQNPFAKPKPAPQPSEPPATEEPAQEEDSVPSERTATHPGWLVYADPAGFSFEYPPPMDTTSTWEGSGRLSINLPDRSLDSAWLELEVIHEAEAREIPDVCTQPNPLSPSDFAYINGIPFSSCTASEGAAGSAYDTYTYITNRNGRIVTMTFTAQTMIDPRINESCTNGEVTDRSCEEFNPVIDARVFRDIIESFRWPDPTLYDMTDERITDEAEGLEIDIRYPVIDDATFAPAFNRQIRSDMRDMAEGMRDMFDEGYEPVEEGAPGHLWTLTLEPTYIYKTNEIVNVFLQGSEYTGGVHPNPLYGSYVYDGSSREFITALAYLESKGLTGSDVAEKCRQALLDHDYISEDEDWIYTGTEPKDENYNVIKIEEDRVIIVFPPYQVGPYAAGPQEVEISL